MLDYRPKESAPDVKSIELMPTISVPQPKPSPVPSQKHKRSFLRWFYDLSISRKTQLIPSFTFVALGGIVGIGAVLIITEGRTQLLNQSKAELTITEVGYNEKINQMGFGFRGQSENPLIIAAAKASVQGQTLNPALRNQVRQTLQHETEARNIEYATLVGKDLRIIANANHDRTGEIFNPNNLVSEVLSSGQQIKTSAIVSGAELAKESPALPPGVANQDVLIRYAVTPVVDPATQTVIGALVSGDIVNGKLPIVEGTLNAFKGGYSAVYLRKSPKVFALATALDKVKGLLKPNVELSNTSLLDAAENARGVSVAKRMDVGGQTYTTAAKAILNFNGEPMAILVRGTPETELNELLKNSLSLQLLLSALGLGVLWLLATLLRQAIAKPVQQLQRSTQEFSEGDRRARAEVFAHDEVGQLAVTFNKMADSIEANLIDQRQKAERALITKDITVKLGQFPQTEGIFNAAVQEIRLALKTDRVVVYGFNENWQGTIIAESVGDGWPRAIGAKIDDPCFADKYVERYRKGRVQPTENIYKAGLNECHLKQLEQFAVKANLVAPILQGDHLLGLLIAHQCSGPRAWQQGEIDLFAQLAAQVGFALDRANLLKQQRTAKETLQRRALELLMEVDPVSKGDLTIRANVTEDEIGTIADSYNATINSLRKIVIQVQAAAKQVAATTSSNEVSVQGVSAEALRQEEEIAAALDQIQEMSNSIWDVANSAEQAEVAVKQATQTVEAGDVAMNLTVNGILAIRATVTETSKKVKQLGESSQQISKVVNLIGRFAAQTNLLALKASIEAARAGEEGRGFAVLADEVRALARQSAEATSEIESLVTKIQTETNEVVAAMEVGTEQVATSTKLVHETRQSLNKIADASAQISVLVEAIASAAVVQSHASESVTQTMSGVAAIASKNSSEANLVSVSFKELLVVAQELQASVGQFKVS